MLVLSPPVGLPRKPLAAASPQLETLRRAEALARHVEALLEAINSEAWREPRGAARTPAEV